MPDPWLPNTLWHSVSGRQFVKTADGLKVYSLAAINRAAKCKRFKYRNQPSAAQRLGADRLFLHRQECSFRVQDAEVIGDPITIPLPR